MIGALHTSEGLVATAIDALRRLADVEGDGSDLHDIARACEHLLTSSLPHGVASPCWLLHGSARMIEAAVETGSAAAGSVRVDANETRHVYPDGTVDLRGLAGILGDIEGVVR